MNLFRVFLLVFSFVLNCLHLHAMDNINVMQQNQVKIFIFPYARIYQDIHVFGGSEGTNNSVWMPFQTTLQIPSNISYESLITNLRCEVARTLHPQTLGMFAHLEQKLTRMLDSANGSQYFLNKFLDEQIYYFNLSPAVAIFFMEVPYICSYFFNTQRQKIKKRLCVSGRLNKLDTKLREYIKKTNFKWIPIDNIFQLKCNKKLMEPLRTYDVKALVNLIKLHITNQ
jgi:hypothetical protein